MAAAILALFAGFLVAVVLSLAADALMRRIGLLPPLGQAPTSPQLAIATVYRALFGVLSAWVTAWLAPYLPLRHALVGGAIGTVLALAGAIGTWHMNLGPHWYPIALVVLALPTAWIGGKLRESQLG